VLDYSNAYYNKGRVPFGTGVLGGFVTGGKVNGYGSFGTLPGFGGKVNVVRKDNYPYAGGLYNGKNAGFVSGPAVIVQQRKVKEVPAPTLVVSGDSKTGYAGAGYPAGYVGAVHPAGYGYGAGYGHGYGNVQYVAPTAKVAPRTVQVVSPVVHAAPAYSGYAPAYSGYAPAYGYGKGLSLVGDQDTAKASVAGKIFDAELAFNPRGKFTLLNKKY